MTRSAIILSRSLSSSAARNFDDSPIGISHTSAMFLPPTVIASVYGLSRAPSQARHGTSRMYPSYCSRDQSLSAPSCRRWIHGITPSYSVEYWRLRP